VPTTYFCPVQPVFNHLNTVSTVPPTVYWYRGYLCQNGNVTEVDVLRPFPSVPDQICDADPDSAGGACPGLGTCCKEDQGYRDPLTPEAARAGAVGPADEDAWWMVYERGVPNPAHPLSEPDSPINQATVVAEFTAEFSYLNEFFRARLFLYAGAPSPRIHGMAFLIDPESPPSPEWVPRFSGNWVRVQNSSEGISLVIRGLPVFPLQRR
jgi:hypothetical protein